MTQRVAVVTDSAASLPASVRGLRELTVVPLTIVVGDLASSEGEGISPDDVAAALDSRVRVTTSQPGVEAFAEALADAAVRGADAAVIVTLSRHLSGTFESARLAARDAQIPVEVVDSGTVAMAQGFAALAAADRAAHGGTLAECARSARQVATSSTCVFTVDSLEPLRRGGRLSAAAAAVGAALAVRPLLEVHDGEIVVGSRERTTRRARAALVAQAVRASGAAPRHEWERDALPVAAVLGLQRESVEHVRTLLTGSDPDVVVVDGPISAALAAHAGSGAVAIATARVPRTLADALRTS